MKILQLSESNRKFVWFAFAKADPKGATMEILAKDLRVHLALDVREELDLLKTEPLTEYKMEDADYDHLVKVYESSAGWPRSPEGIAPVLAARNAIKAAKEPQESSEKKEESNE